MGMGVRVSSWAGPEPVRGLLLEPDGQARRVGLIHALTNVTAASLYGASLLARSQKRRTLGRILAFAGYGFVTMGGYLGGHLVYAKQIGVDHAAELRQPKKFREVMA